MHNQTLKRAKKQITACLLFCCIAIQPLQSASVLDGNRRMKYNFNSQWLLHIGDVQEAQLANFDDSSWQKITLPRAFNENEAFKVAIDNHSTSIVWYRKHFKLPQKENGKKVFLEFEGIRFGGAFYLNGTLIGRHENGVMACGFDISDQVKFDGKENILALKIDNSWDYQEQQTGSTYQWNNKNFNANYGGIPKNVYLHTTHKTYQTLPLYSNLGTTGTYIYAREINISKKTALVCAESEIRNEQLTPQKVRYEVTLMDPNGDLIQRTMGNEITINPGETQTVSAESNVSNLNFWSWGYGYLYTVNTSLWIDGKQVDVVKTKTGFRKTAFREGMVWLNDRIIQLKGYAQRTSNEWPAVGMSIPAWLSDFSNQLIVEGNGNLVRWMHVTPWKQDVESCDRVGLIQAMPAGDAEKDATGRKWEQRVELMRDAIIYNRNNPSILFYESGNESISEEHMAEMKAIRDKFDPYGGRAIGSREMLDSKIAEYGGEMLYVNKSAKIPMWATEYCRDEALRKYWDEYSFPFHKNGDGPLYKDQNASSYNRNQDSFAIESVIRWYDFFRVRPGTGKRTSSGGANIIFSDTNTHFRGAENYRRSGEVDAMRIPKDAFFAHQVMWDGWVDPENPRTHLIGHWNYDSKTVKDIFVISSGQEVELFVNGKSKGFGKRSYHFLFTFESIAWEAGTIKAVSYDIQKKAISSAELKTASEPSKIELTLIKSPDGFKADGADLALIEVQIVDKEGNRCPLSNELIHFELKGAAEYRGGIAQGDSNYILSKQLPVECGINRILIRATTQSGNIELTASANGLPSQTIHFKSLPCKSIDGLSTYISSDFQPSNLSRGDGLVGKPIINSRNPIQIVGARCGSNEQNAPLSYDDNELTEWANNGQMNTGWISYELEKDAVVSEIELKLTGWRMRSYPIQILIDDIEVYSGNTEKSLGYISIPIVPTKGRFVKIKLIGQSSDKDAFNDIVEITGTKELDLYKDPKALKAKGELRIVEIEIYQTTSENKN